MKNNTLIKYNDEIYRILDTTDTRAFIINCKKKSIPRWVDIDSLFCFLPCSDYEKDNFNFYYCCYNFCNVGVLLKKV